MRQTPKTFGALTVANKKRHSDLITELVWKAAHADPTYDIHRAKVVSDLCKVPVATLMKVVRHAQRTPKTVNWDVISTKIIQ